MQKWYACHFSPAIHCNHCKLMKKIILIFLFLTSSISSALACDVKIIPFGSGKEKININPLPLSFPNQFDSETVIVPISDICKNDKDLFELPKKQFLVPYDMDLSRLIIVLRNQFKNIHQIQSHQKIYTNYRGKE